MSAAFTTTVFVVGLRLWTSAVTPRVPGGDVGEPELSLVVRYIGPGFGARARQRERDAGNRGGLSVRPRQRHGTGHDTDRSLRERRRRTQRGDDERDVNETNPPGHVQSKGKVWTAQGPWLYIGRFPG